MPFAGNNSKLDPLISPVIHKTGNPWPTFSTLPFVMHDAEIVYTGSAHVNYQLIFGGDQSYLKDSAAAAPSPPAPVQYGELFPLQFAPGYFVKWVAELGPDPIDAFFPALGVLRDAQAPGALNIGFTRPGVGLEKEAFVVCQGIDTDGTTVLAQATYRIKYVRA